MADILTNKRPACFNLGKQPTLSSQTVFILLDSWFSIICKKTLSCNVIFVLIIIRYWYLEFVFCVCLLVFSMSCCCVIMRIVSADNRVLTGSMSVVGAPAEKCIFHSSGFKRHCIQLFKCFTYPWAWLKTQWSTLTPEDPYSSSNLKLATSLSLIWNFVFEFVFFSFYSNFDQDFDFASS